MSVFQQSDYLPQFPEECVAPHLTRAQCHVYNGIQRVTWSDDWQNGEFPLYTLRAVDDVEVAPAAASQAE